VVVGFPQFILSASPVCSGIERKKKPYSVS